MRFGTCVKVQRGSSGVFPGTPGSLRWVQGTLVGAIGFERIVRLEQDDPLDTVGWKKKGDVGRWSVSVVRPIVEEGGKQHDR